MKTTKRILEISVKREYDADSDTSYLGNYSDDPGSGRYAEWVIERQHDVDCLVNRLPRNVEYDDEGFEVEPTCNCGGGARGRGEFHYYHPSFNVLNEDGTITAMLSEEDAAKYIKRDYDRLEALNAGSWQYIGIRAEAVVSAGDGSPTQTIFSGGLWGIESDSDKEYLTEVEQEELSALRAELTAYGFSKRAISTAMRDVQQRED